MRNLLKQIRACRVCDKHLPHGSRPIVQGHPEARILIIGQAPGLKAHDTGVPWNDASGDRLRQWLNLSKELFYDPKTVALLPIGFCYPGRAVSGDLAPRKECYELWHQSFYSSLSNIKLTFLVGNYAQAKYLQHKNKLNATETIRSWRNHANSGIPMPHPSPRNNIWLHKNPWFIEEVLPEIRKMVSAII